MRPGNPTFTISRLARDAGVNIETVRYYQRRGLMPLQAQRNGIRRYNEKDTERLRFIKRAQSMGFSLEEVRSLIQLRQNPSCRATRAIAIEKLKALDEQIVHLQELRDELASMADRCARNSVEGVCPVIERIEH
jgi:MerR family transcriptional regulator, mercuric resistance operon regulatory protein